MDMRLVSSPSELLQLNAALQYFQDLHRGLRPGPPDVSEAHMAAAMEVWLNRRKHIVNGILSGFLDLEEARQSGKPTADILIGLVKRVDNHNGLFLPHFLDSFEAATGSTPIEGWLFKSAPRDWRLFKRTQYDMRPVDYPGLFFQREHSYYLTFIEGLLQLALGSKQFIAGYSLLTSGMLFVLAQHHTSSVAFDATAATILSLGLVFAAVFLIIIYLLGSESRNLNKFSKDK